MISLDESLPRCLRDGNYLSYVGVLNRSWDAFCKMWWNIAWVRCQGFWRDGDAEAEENPG